MDDKSNLTDQHTEAPTPAAEAGVTFLRALFAESDTILFRPIETWIEAGRKRSRVDYRNTCYRRALPNVLQDTVPQLFTLSEVDSVNIFFGVCPRLGTEGRFDLAWQIRTARTLWTDIDRVTVDKARERVFGAGLPEPSIIVNSGSGVHLYWLLNDPYLIDDVGDPPPVETEWSEFRDGRRKLRKYIVENGDRVYLDQRRHVSRLSRKAQYFQDILAGMAKACGGDHTTDLSRLLRLPGSFNRKDQRNGTEPVATVLVECEPTRTYAMASFDPLKSTSPLSERANQIAAMPLPTPRRVSPSKGDKLAELIAGCSIAEAGSRSEADFAVCCYAIRNGIGKEEIWTQVERVGKFAEQGRRYFELTWDNAQYDVRADVFDKLQQRTKPKAQTAATKPGEPFAGALDGEAGDADSTAVGIRQTIFVDPVTTPVADTLQQVTDCLLSTGNCFTRADQLVFIHDQAISPVLSSPELAGLLNQYVEFYFVDEPAGEYKPLPPAYANTWLNQRIERGRLPVMKLFARHPVYTDDWRLVEPGFDAQSGIYYAGQAVEIRKVTTHLDALLQDFCFRG